MREYDNYTPYQKPAKEILVSKTNYKETSNYSVDITGDSKIYCVGLVDMAKSTKISAGLNQEKMSRYYEIFLNSMANIVEKFGGFVIKNIGDSLLYYFPDSSKSNTRYGYLSCLECNLNMIELHNPINKIMQQEDLPPLNYRVSADYGKVIIMKSTNSKSIDILGAPVNICTKINDFTPENEAVIGSDLYQMVKGFDDYKYKMINDYSIGLKNSYPIYLLQRK